MFSNSIKKALVVAGVALTLPVLSAGTAYADNDNGHGKGSTKHETASVQTETAQHGKSGETDKSGSSTNPDGTFQGKSSSTPDQDGKGMDRGAVNNDKTGPGTDGNNGCGNEPRVDGHLTDDDNNGWCGNKPKPQHAKAAVVKAQAHTVALPARFSAPVTSTTTSAARAAAPAVVAPAPKAVAPKVIAHGKVTRLAGRAAAAAVAGPVAGPVAPRAAVAAAAAPSALPFTGAPVGLLLVVAGLAIGLGGLSTYAGTSRTA